MKIFSTKVRTYKHGDYLTPKPVQVWNIFGFVIWSRVL
jgi:hypothetical protein